MADSSKWWKHQEWQERLPQSPPNALFIFKALQLHLSDRFHVIKACPFHSVAFPDRTVFGSLDKRRQLSQGRKNISKSSCRNRRGKSSCWNFLPGEMIHFTACTAFLLSQSLLLSRLSWLSLLQGLWSHFVSMLRKQKNKKTCQIFLSILQT